MPNCVGYCDNFLSYGKSSIWNKNGELICKLNQDNQGAFIYDTELETTNTFYRKIVK